MHQTQSGDELPSVDVHLLVQEDKVHLEEDEDQLKTDSQEPERHLISIPGIVSERCVRLFSCFSHLDTVVVSPLLSSNISPSSIPA